MHRSWFRTKLVEKREEVKTKVKESVTQKAKGLIPRQPGPRDACMVCGKALKPRAAVQGDGRVCSPGCAQAWVRDL